MANDEQRLYRPEDSTIPPGYYRLTPRMRQPDDSLILMAGPLRVEVDDQRRYRPWDGSGDWVSLDDPSHSHCVLKGPYATHQELCADL